MEIGFQECWTKATHKNGLSKPNIQILKVDVLYSFMYDVLDYMTGLIILFNERISIP